MIPSLFAGELRGALVEYLSTTFALSDDEARAELARFLAHPTEGIFRGPYLRVRTPFRQVEPAWVSPLRWMPAGFRPYVHQAEAFARLSSDNRQPQPTIVTTGTGSGKTEAFLYPILDHCVRMQGRPGIKALLLYPMNALATDQARRLAGLLYAEPGLGGISAGIYVGEDGPRTSGDREHLVDKREALRENPPDILLTNYKMLDWLLLRRADRDLWATSGPDSLAYIVLDELHTYDGAQGTDVAMLVRRLGARLGLARPGQPLGDVTPVATSATLGAGPVATATLLEFAQRVFGIAFPEEAVIGETRQEIAEACLAVDYALPIPAVDEVLGLLENDWDELAAAFTGQGEPFDPVTLGEALLHHHLTRAVLASASESARDWAGAVEAVVASVPSWGVALQQKPDAVGEALARFVGLLSMARRPDGHGGSLPLFAIEVQLWVREVARLLRDFDRTPHFAWMDAGSSASEGPNAEAGDGSASLTLPAIYCRHCGRSGWMALATELVGRLRAQPRPIYAASRTQPGRLRALLRARVEEAGTTLLDPQNLCPAASEDPHGMCVLATPGEEEAKRSECPSCGESDSIRFLGSQVASLASVCISQLFGSSLVNVEERKLLAFTDSVQDASHRASFFAGRTHRFNLRTCLAGQVVATGKLSLDDVGSLLLAEAGADGSAIHALVPPDLLSHPGVATAWTDSPSRRGREILDQRLRLEAALEVGLRTRVGRTLELSGALAAFVEVGDIEDVTALVAEAHQHVSGQGSLGGTVNDLSVYVIGTLERLRLRGAIWHPWLDSYVHEDGNTWRVWGGRTDGCPAFPSGQSRPTFLINGSDGSKKVFDSLAGPSRTPTWLVDWAGRTLRAEPAQARMLNQATFVALVAEGLVGARTTRSGATVYGLDPRRVMLVDITEDDAAEAAESGTSPCALRCGVCVGRHVVASDQLIRWVGTPCLRYRCPGTYERAPAEASNYYRRLYRSAAMRRVVTAEHTGMLSPAKREKLESAFKVGTDPAAPNVVVCTPTMELGIDIGDLSAVLLTSVPRGPASYIQRVGRAGRLSGNAFVAAFVPTDPRALYYLAEPEHMLAGEVRPPNCYLDAIELLRRQYFAYLCDRAAAGLLDAPAMPRQIGQLVQMGMDEGSWLAAIVSGAAVDADVLAAAFLALFGASVEERTAQLLHEWAAVGLAGTVKAAIDDWRAREDEEKRRRDRLSAGIRRLEDLAYRDEETERDLRWLRGERQAVISRIRAVRRDYTLKSLESLGLLPNYSLLGDVATLSASLWSEQEDGSYDTTHVEYQRPASIALTEFAPGNGFYVDGHRLAIDALELGSILGALEEWWRLCPECGYGAPETTAEQWTACPRCHLPQVADTGARHLLLRFRHAYSVDSEERSRVFDETDERRREHYNVVTTVDVDPNDVEVAWQHETETFAMERALVATIRYVNVGAAARGGEEIRIGGEDHFAPRFQTCRHCGTVQGAQAGGRARGGDRDEHRGWCLTRSGRKEDWVALCLFHEMRTEAVRLLLPVSTVEVRERLASFKAALLLGLRLDFGGEPEHISVTVSEYPGSGGHGPRRLLVLHDTVPGGTGYLGRVADPERLHSILEGARDAISRCVCRREGRVACHRCLLGSVSGAELPDVSRGLALELLDQLLEHWSFGPIASVVDTDIGSVEESELERRFKTALRCWARNPESAASLTPRPAPPGREAFELRLRSADTSLRWLIEEQRNVGAEVVTRPDFLLTRQDGPAMTVAVYLDGRGFHASQSHNRLADDASKRRALRSAGYVVWGLCWDDVNAFHLAAEADVAKQAPNRPLLDGRGRLAAGQVLVARGDGRGPDLEVADHNPLRQLLEFLRHPDPPAWERLVLAEVAGAVATSGSTSRLARDSVPRALATALAGGDGEDLVAAKVEGGGSAAADVLAARPETGKGLVLHCFLDTQASVGGANAERWTVIMSLPDDPGALVAPWHPERWRDWLQWSNLLQFLGGPGREAMICTTSEAARMDVADLELGGTVLAGFAGFDGESGGVDEVAVQGDLSPEALEELELVLDQSTRALAELVLRRGAPLPVAGHEPDVEGASGWVLELAWPDSRVAVLAAGENEPARDAWLAAHGWDARPAVAWSPEALLSALDGVG